MHIKKKNFFFFLLDASCPNGQCPIEKVCSIRESNGFNCACFPGYYGASCQIGLSLFYFLFLFFFHSFSFLSFRFQLKKIFEKKFLKTIIGVYCSSISNEGNAKWNETLANGKSINGHCLDGYQGSISRKCFQSGSIGNWGSISGSCNGINYFLFF